MDIPGFSGRVTLRGDDGFADACAIFNTAVDGRVPRAVAACASTADVAAAVRFAREADLPLSVRAGGHNFAGHALAPDGLVLDLRGMRDARVDPAARVVTCGPGHVWGTLDAATSPFGLHTNGGSISTVGVSGFTLGTGLGHLAREHGMAGDDVVAAEVVLADGSVVRTDSPGAEDLDWALRGGCGNFGVVTSWDLALHPVETVYAGTLAVALPDARAALTTVLEDLAPRTPAALTWVAVMATLPPAAPVPDALRGVPSLLLNLVSLDPRAGPGLVEPWRRALPVTMDAVDHVPFVAYQQSADASAPEGCGWDVRSEWLSGLDGRTAQVMVDAAEAALNPLYEVLVRPLGGRAAEIAADATPFSWRHSEYLLEVIAGWFPDDPREPTHRDWMTGAWDGFLPWSDGGACISHVGRGEGPERVRSAYGERAWERLVAVKTDRDPDDVFRSTQHIAPRRPVAA